MYITIIPETQNNIILCHTPKNGWNGFCWYCLKIVCFHISIDRLTLTLRVSVMVKWVSTGTNWQWELRDTYLLWAQVGWHWLLYVHIGAYLRYMSLGVNNFRNVFVSGSWSFTGGQPWTRHNCWPHGDQARLVSITFFILLQNAAVRACMGRYKFQVIK